MLPQITPADAAAALAEVETARTAMRRAVRAHRGHYHLWIWGGIWIVMPLSVTLWGEEAARFFGWICAAGWVASMIVGATQCRQIRSSDAGRFSAPLVVVLAFGAIYPFVLRAQPDFRHLYAYIGLVFMQWYVIAGLWMDSYLLWLGLAVTVLILVGLFVFPGIFWLWMAVFGGGSLVLTGFYVRHFWR
ncbi:MAG TPA: hypothetical protein VHE61_20620 [Opitutaceae bacterium]|nr:hypothetical protein [Opitutaceae bacterium]